MHNFFSKYIIKYCDTHAHIDFSRFDEDREEMLKKALDSNVVRIVNPAVNLENSEKILKLCEKHPFIWAAIGIHPNDSNNLPNDWIKKLEYFALHPKVVAIGEIGLDFYRDYAEKNVQKAVFIEQIRLAKLLNLPIIVHIRDAHSEAQKILDEEKYYYGVLHSFSGDEKFLEWALERGFYIGVGGPITFKNYRNWEIIKKVPLDKILLETDCPYLSPHPLRGKRNEPANIPIIAEKLSEIFSVSAYEIARTSTENASKLFGFESPYMLRRAKQMGQNFLVNRGIVRKVADFAGYGNFAIEIGAGKGIITEEIAERFSKIYAVEFDEDLVRELDKNLSGENIENVVILYRDILKLNLENVVKYIGARPLIIGNIPYSISSPIVFYLVENRSFFDRAIFIMQREFADRLCAHSGTKSYGIPTVILGRYFEIAKRFDIKPGSFSPQPKIMSSVVELNRRENAICDDVEHNLFTKIVRASFAHRRKKLSNNLREIYPDIDIREIFTNIGIDENARAEQLSVKDFCKIAREISSMGK